ncbi:hypothetical protein AGOR_G00214360 [Albula goreensis]|uniref:Uncharacterized protein n=1 Tax=Albula goreensis TaxID=1534307 RepID=A0A8T3CNR9_9TELE|nr:hypothetical protein AGOR_G00214360 [Albula goreensis]
MPIYETSSFLRTQLRAHISNYLHTISNSRMFGNNTGGIHPSGYDLGPQQPQVVEEDLQTTMEELQVVAPLTTMTMAAVVAENVTTAPTVTGKKVQTAITGNAMIVTMSTVTVAIVIVMTVMTMATNMVMVITSTNMVMATISMAVDVVMGGSTAVDVEGTPAALAAAVTKTRTEKTSRGQKVNCAPQGSLPFNHSTC